MATERIITLKSALALLLGVAMFTPVFHWLYYSSIVIYFIVPFLVIFSFGFGKAGSAYRLLSIALTMAFAITFLVTTRLWGSLGSAAPGSKEDQWGQYLWYPHKRIAFMNSAPQLHQGGLGERTGTNGVSIDCFDHSSA